MWFRTEGRPAVLEFGNVMIDFDKHRVTVNGEIVSLTPTEYTVLELMASSPGRPFTRTAFNEAIYGL